MRIKDVKYLLVPIAILAVFVLLFKTFQNEKAYKNTIGKRFYQYSSNGEFKYKEYKPFAKISNNNLDVWDSHHYSEIKDHLYNKALSSQANLGFFPLFPIIWRITGLSFIGISVFNYLLFVISLFFMFKLMGFLETKNNTLLFALLICTPFAIPFIIPYSESVFFASFVLALYGYFKSKNWMLFLGLFLISFTRSVFGLLLLSFAFVELIMFIKQRDFKTSLIRGLKFALPILAAVVAVSCLQLLRGANSPLEWMSAQKHWGTKLGIPNPLTDWSLEGFSMNLPTIIIVSIPFAGFIVKYIWDLFLKNKSEDINVEDLDWKKQYIFLVSSFYFGLVTLFVYLFKGGNIHSMFRYILSTPFFYFALFFILSKLKDLRSKGLALSIFSVLSFITIWIYSLTPYTCGWSIADLGLFALLFTFATVLFINLKSLLGKLLYLLAIGINIIWLLFLYNIMLNDGWIFL